jgi:hypothetical protein
MISHVGSDVTRMRSLITLRQGIGTGTTLCQHADTYIINIKDKLKLTFMNFTVYLILFSNVSSYLTGHLQSRPPKALWSRNECVNAVRNSLCS